LDRKET
jgi:hypothetical protein